MTTPTTQAGQSKRPGLTDGVVNELSIFLTVKPGHEEQMRQAIHVFLGTEARNRLDLLRGVGIHELRQVLFDNGRRFLLATSFEGDWDKYIDDIIAGLGVDDINLWLQHAEGIPDGGIIGMTHAQVKEIFAANQITAEGYKVTIPDVTLAETLDALRVFKAFQQVLDHPDAAVALAHPALKPLLEQASH